MFNIKHVFNLGSFKMINYYSYYLNALYDIENKLNFQIHQI